MNLVTALEQVHKTGALSSVLVPDYVNYLTATLDSAVHAIIDFMRWEAPSEFPQVSIAPAIARESLKFHQAAGTLTENVRANIEHLAYGAPIIRVAHQPNLLAHLGVFGQCILLDALASRLQSHLGRHVSQLFIIVDYDASNDRRFRSVHFPDAQRESGYVSLSVPLRRNQSDIPMFMADKPSEDQVKKWFSDVEQVVKQDLGRLKRLGVREIRTGNVLQALDETKRLLWEILEQSSTLAEFNSSVISHVVNIRWALPTSFVPGSALQQMLRPAHEFILSYFPSIVSHVEEGVGILRANAVEVPFGLASLSEGKFPVWIICADCKSRVALRFDSLSHYIVEGNCKNCGRRHHLDLGTPARPNLTSISSYLLPRIILDNLSDLVGLKIVGGANYIGSAGHFLLTNFVAARLGWKMPPNCLWRPKGIYYSTAEIRALQIMMEDQNRQDQALKALRLVQSGRASIMFYILNRPPDALHRMWKSYLEAGGNLYELNDGRDGCPFSLPESIAQSLQLISKVA